MYGTLTLICGPMFAGKTTEIIRRILHARTQHGASYVGLDGADSCQVLGIEVFKPEFDNRYAETQIVSHDGLHTPARPIKAWTGVQAETKLVFFDEIQFFIKPYFKGDLPKIVEDLLQQGVDVVGSGLDMDWQGKPFAVTAHLAAMADEIMKLKSLCAVCGQPASKTHRRSLSGGQVELGGADKYEPRCTLHWASARVPDLFNLQNTKVA